MPLTLALNNITHHYGSKCALENLSLTIAFPSLVALIGPNGGGKSTLLKLVAGLLKLQQGSFDLSVPRHKIAYVAQQSTLDHHFPIRVFDVVAMGLFAKIGCFGKLTRDNTENIFKALHTVGLEGFEYAPINTLSGGQFQRMMFARVIVQDADLLLLDEPFAAIDSETKHQLMKLIQNWHNDGKTILVVLHDIKLAADYFPHIVMLSKNVLKSGSSQEIFGTEFLNSPLFTQELI